MVELAETAGAAVWDVNNALNFPNKHPLCLSMDKASLRHTDLVVGLDVNDWEKQLTELNSAKRTREPLTPASCDFVEIGFGEINISKWAIDYCRMQPCSVRALGDTALGIPRAHPHLQGAHRGRRQARGPHRRAQGRDRQAPRRGLGEMAGGGAANWDASPITFSRLALEVWDVIKDEDWVLTANTLKQQVRKLWDFDKPYRHPGVELGTSTQIGISLGVALAHKDTGRVVVDIQPDGDLMFDAGALWVAAKYEIPMLVVMHNNRAYYNDWAHQIRMAQAARHRRDQGPYRHGPVRAGAGLRRARPLHGLLRRRPDRQAEGHPPRAAARARRGQEGAARAGGHDHAAPVIAVLPCDAG